MDDRMNDMIDEVQKRLGEEYEVNGGLRQYGIRIKHLSMPKTILLLPECSIKQQRASH